MIILAFFLTKIMDENKQRAKVFISQGQRNLNLAKNELLKPQKNVLLYSVCKNSQFSIENYLKGYLMNHAVQVENDLSIEELLTRCIRIDPRFENIDLNDIECKKHKIDSRYCTDYETVCKCYDTADTLDTFFRKINLV